MWNYGHWSAKWEQIHIAYFTTYFCTFLQHILAYWDNNWVHIFTYFAYFLHISAYLLYIYCKFMHIAYNEAGGGPWRRAHGQQYDSRLKGSRTVTGSREQPDFPSPWSETFWECTVTAVYGDRTNRPWPRAPSSVVVICSCDWKHGRIGELAKSNKGFFVHLNNLPTRSLGESVRRSSASGVLKNGTSLFV